MQNALKVNTFKLAGRFQRKLIKGKIGNKKNHDKKI